MLHMVTLLVCEYTCPNVCMSVYTHVMCVCAGWSGVHVDRVLGGGAAIRGARVSTTGIATGWFGWLISWLLGLGGVLWPA
jgi:hypothetical protein